MGVQGTGGVGGGVSRHRPSHVAYYIALAGILGLLTLLLLYFFYFFIKKVRKFNSTEFYREPSSCRPPPAATAYPVQPVVREGASEMAKLCKLPPTGRGGSVFPTSTSPAAQTHTGETPPASIAPGSPGAPIVAGAPVVAGPTVAPPTIEPASIKPAPPVTPAIVVQAVPVQ